MSALSGLAQCLFAPKSVALVGASGDERKHTSLPQRYLRRHGYQGAVYPVNRGRAEIFGERAYPSVRAIERPVDHAFIMLPTDAVLAALDDCASAGVRCVTILSNGFAEAGPEGAALQETIVDKARKAGMRVLGPNSLGVVNTLDRVALSANEVLSLPVLPAGGFGLVSQSGSLLGALLSRGQARGFGFSRIASVGNEADLGLGEIAQMLVDDPQTDAILLFIETIRDARSVAVMARCAFNAGKPVVCFRLGRSPLGAALATSHTGALTSNGAALDAFLDACGIVRVELLDTLLHAPTLLKGRRPGSGDRVMAMSTTGGGGGLVVDALAERGLQVAAPDPILISRLQAKGIRIGSSALIDLTLGGTNAKIYGTVLHEVLRSSSSDAVVAVVGSSAQFRPDRAVEPTVTEANGYPGKPVAVFLTPHAEQAFTRLHQAGVAAFLTPETCSDGLKAYLRWRAPREAATDRPNLSAAADALAAATVDRLDEVRASRVFAALGVTQPQEIILPPCPDSIENRSLRDLAFPVVAKVLSADVAHKTEAGGVILGIESIDELREACRRILRQVQTRCPDARIEGILVQAMERGLSEALVGYRRDPNVGPIVTLGAGGVLTELYRDFTVRLAPVDLATARGMISEVRGLAILCGYRGLPLGDLDALARTVRAVSWLAAIEEPVVLEAELNPVLVRPQGQGVVALDALIVRRAA